MDDLELRKEANYIAYLKVQEERQTKLWVCVSTILASIIGSSVLIYQSYIKSKQVEDINYTLNLMARHLLEINDDLILLQQKTDKTSGYCIENKLYNKQIAERIIDEQSIKRYQKP